MPRARFRITSEMLEQYVDLETGRKRKDFPFKGDVRPIGHYQSARDKANCYHNIVVEGADVPEVKVLTKADEPPLVHCIAHRDGANITLELIADSAPPKYGSDTSGNITVEPMPELTKIEDDPAPADPNSGDASLEDIKLDDGPAPTTDDGDENDLGDNPGGDPGPEEQRDGGGTDQPEPEPKDEVDPTPSPVEIDEEKPKASKGKKTKKQE
jgi:hypothetical protein